MVERLKNLAARINARALRERVLLLVTAVVVVVALADGLFLARLRDALDRTAAQREEVAASLAASRKEVTSLRDKLAEDPDAEIRQRIDRLRQRVRGVESNLESKRQKLIGASEMVGVLRDLVASDQGLELVSVESQPTEVVEEFAVGDAGQNDSSPARVYSHGVQLVLKGRFHDALGYLRTVEALRWRFFWDQLDIEVIDYPKTRIRLRLHTLSLDEEWIGV
jgi:MSHA biogenesis protein MshJ